MLLQKFEKLSIEAFFLVFARFSVTFTTPEFFFRDGHFRQEKYQKPSGKTFRDGYRQGCSVSDRLSGKVDFPWRKPSRTIPWRLFLSGKTFSVGFLFYATKDISCQSCHRQGRFKLYLTGTVPPRKVPTFPFSEPPSGKPFFSWLSKLIKLFES